jgi:hypothetical protein
MQERRKYQRIEGTLPLKLSDSEFDIVTETKNISGSGVYCSVNTPLEPMTKVKIVILLPLKSKGRKSVKKITCGGVVVRKEYVRNNGNHLYYVGIYFNDIKESDRKQLLSYIDSLSAPSQEPSIMP